MSSQIVPFTYDKDLVWQTSYSITELKNFKLLYLNELLLLYKNFLSAFGTISIKENEEKKNSFYLNTEIRMKGTGLFSYIKCSDYGKIKIDENGFVSEITFNKNNKCIFIVKNKNQEKK
ncbi:MAG: hypothetical protein NC934_07545 [Candidatus Omnitrophica bacterium]|nr:hypothetical protein [Candidatus Omnitrophota bacterium]